MVFARSLMIILEMANALKGSNIQGPALSKLHFEGNGTGFEVNFIATAGNPRLHCQTVKLSIVGEWALSVPVPSS